MWQGEADYVQYEANIWTPQTVSTKMEAPSCLGSLCILWYYLFPSLKGRGLTHTRSSLTVPLCTKQGLWRQGFQRLAWTNLSDN